jgi:drug/metabolite transporter (DMT)-like permease
MVVTYFLLKARYSWVQLVGVCICVGGLGVLVYSDIKTGKDWGYTNKGVYHREPSSLICNQLNRLLFFRLQARVTHS